MKKIVLILLLPSLLNGTSWLKGSCIPYKPNRNMHITRKRRRALLISYHKINHYQQSPNYHFLRKDTKYYKDLQARIKLAIAFKQI
jgi:hypothetical protein